MNSEDTKHVEGGPSGGTLADKAWVEHWRVCVEQHSDQVHGRNFVGTPRDYVLQMQWTILDTSPDGMVLARDQSQQELAIGRSPDARNALLLVLHKASLHSGDTK